jgi:hypothetical protein
MGQKKPYGANIYYSLLALQCNPWHLTYDSPQHVPISPIKKRCKKNCCEVTFIPLTVAFALTLHKFQGWETSWADNSTVSYLLVDIGSILDELRAPGTCYAALSRPHTIGDLTSNRNEKSALYLIGNDICFNRIRNVGLTKTGEPSAFVKTRNQWVKYLNERKVITDSWIAENRNEWRRIYETKIKHNYITKVNLEARILERIESLNTNFI